MSLQAFCLMKHQTHDTQLESQVYLRNVNPPHLAKWTWALYIFKTFLISISYCSLYY